ncbi:MAG: hypothetical protein MJZ98_00670 [Paludibacteraceae bacterium]|nr:hypothetical protein [Paludibacteraceae bacterium]
MLIFPNGTLEYCILQNSQRVAYDYIAPTGSCECYVELSSENLRERYGEGTEHTANITIQLDSDSVADGFNPTFVRFKTERDTKFSNWLEVKSIKYYFLVGSYSIECQ